MHNARTAKNGCSKIDPFSTRPQAENSQLENDVLNDIQNMNSKHECIVE